MDALENRFAALEKETLIIGISSAHPYTDIYQLLYQFPTLSSLFETSHVAPIYLLPFLKSIKRTRSFKRIQRRAMKKLLLASSLFFGFIKPLFFLFAFLFN